MNVSDLEAAAQRILSARKHKISDQHNVIQELQKQIDILQLENKTLKSQSYRQEKELSKVKSMFYIKSIIFITRHCVI